MLWFYNYTSLLVIKIFQIESDKKTNIIVLFNQLIT